MMCKLVVPLLFLLGVSIAFPLKEAIFTHEGRTVFFDGSGVWLLGHENKLEGVEAQRAIEHMNSLMEKDVQLIDKAKISIDHAYNQVLSEMGTDKSNLLLDQVKIGHSLGVKFLTNLRTLRETRVDGGVKTD